jgi:hypothetical protein
MAKLEDCTKAMDALKADAVKLNARIDAVGGGWVGHMLPGKQGHHANITPVGGHPVKGNSVYERQFPGASEIPGGVHHWSVNRGSGNHYKQLAHGFANSEGEAKSMAESHLRKHETTNRAAYRAGVSNRP